MSSNKKLLLVKLIVLLIITFFVSTFIYLIVKIDITERVINNKKYIRDEESDKESYESIGNEEEKHERGIKNNKRNSDLEFIKNDKSFNDDKKEKKNDELDLNIIEDEDIYKKSREKIQYIYDSGEYDKNSWIIIDEDRDFYGYNFYFDNEGKLIYDTVTPDYRVVDKYGREVNDNLEAVLYEVERVRDVSTSSNISSGDKVSTQVIVTKNVVIKKSEKVYDNQMNRNVIDYIDKSLGFKKKTNGRINGDKKWLSVSSLKNNGGYVVFKNPKNNFNKIIGKIAIQNTEWKKTNLTLLIYDADLYDLYSGYEYLLEPIYETQEINSGEIFDFSFNFFRTVKRLRFQIESDVDKENIICYLKDLRFGFDKKKYKEELEAAKENEEYIKYLKELGLYKSDEEMLSELRALMEDNQSDYLEYEDFIDEVDINEIEGDIDKKQRMIDKRTGPAFDEYLKNLRNFWEMKYGPGY